MRMFFCAVVLLLTLQGLHAQKGKNPYKFGDIKPEDFSPTLHSFDSTADAVVLADIGSSYFRESSDGWFVMVYERHQRIKVITKSGMDAANFSIQQYKSGSAEEKLLKLKASTFNLEGDKVVESKLLEKDIFKDKLDKNYSLTKFGLPNVKEGSILEVDYIIESDFFQFLRSWNFQGTYPRVHTEYTAVIPEFFNYLVYGQGYLPIDKKSKSIPHTYTITQRDNEAFSRTERFQIPTNDVESHWAMNNVPALKREPFTTTLDNHLSKINFQLASYNFPGTPPQPRMSTWPKLCEMLMNNENFGAHLKRPNNWLDEDIKKITGDSKSQLEKAKALHAHMREKFAVSKEGSGFGLSDVPRNLWKNMKGSTSDANIMLITLLKAAGIDANPVLLSTRDNGIANEMYPLLNDYNYVIGHFIIDDKSYYVDCSDPMISLGHLPLDCYNGHARILKDHDALPVYLDADDVKENKTTMINIFSLDPEKTWTGEVSSRLGYYESLSLREKVKESGMGKVTTDIKNGLPAEVEVKEPVITDLKDYEKAVSVKYGLDFSNIKDEDIIYINPMLGERQKENPFTAAERVYPVEMPYAFKETVIFTIQVPQDYVVDELPKSSRVKLDDNGTGMFEYLVQQTDNMIQGRVVVELKQANFAAETYDQLREFFIYVINKQGEQIVLKKKAKP